MATKALLQGVTHVTGRGGPRRDWRRGWLLAGLCGALGALPATGVAQPAVTYFPATAAPNALARRAAADALSATVNDAMSRVTGRGTWGVMVVSLSSGDTLFGHNADRMLVPASTMKLFTSALALEYIGPDGRLQTQLLHTGRVAGSVLDGDLILRGAGDPTLGGRKNGPGSVAPMTALARAVAGSGIRRVTGSIIGDASVFDDSKVPEGWLRRYLHASYAARVSGLSFNENAVTVLVGPGSGTAAAVQFNPAISGIGISNAVRVVAGSRGARVVVSQDTVAGRVRVSGWIGSKSAVRGYKLVVENPELFAVGALKAALEAEGVKVDGGIGVGTAQRTATELASLESPTMEQMVAQMNGESNNHIAELLFRNAARNAADHGSAAAANSLLSQFLAERVLADSQAVFAADGSGLSTLDRVTPRAMVQLLDYSRRAPWGDVLVRSLPVAGMTETLARRMRRTPAMGNLRAKTGTTNEVVSLGGYVTASNGEDLAFAIIYNGTNRFRARVAIDTIGVALARFNR